MSAANTVLWLVGMQAWLAADRDAMRAPEAPGRKALADAIEGAEFWFEDHLKKRWIAERTRDLLNRTPGAWTKRQLACGEGNDLRAHATFAEACIRFLEDELFADLREHGVRQPEARASFEKLRAKLVSYAEGLRAKLAPDSMLVPVVPISPDPFATLIAELAKMGART